MEVLQNEAQKQKIGRKPNEEIITELPINVIEKILVCLPIRDAVRTSILSRKWRNKWVTLPQLTFDNIFSDSPDKLINFIDRFLLLHNGPIEKFTFSSINLLDNSSMDRWILFLSRKGIKELKLIMYRFYKVPYCLFSCKQLNYLMLHGCIFKSPPALDGFNSLKSLHLQVIIFVECTFESLISSCPLLERLTLICFVGFTDLIIRAPNLRYLYLNGNFKSIRFMNTPLLATASIGLMTHYEEAENDEHHMASNLTRVLGCLTSIEELNVWGYFWEFLAVGRVPNMLLNTFNHLKILGLSQVRFNYLDEFSAVVCLIKSTPNLQIFQILVILDDTNADDANAEVGSILEYLEAQNFSECWLNQLRFVNILGISGDGHDLEFIKILLAITPVLKRMTVQLNGRKLPERGSRVLKELVRFRRASPEAEIAYLE